MKTVLLTGATGFVGRTTIKHLLDRDFIVHAISSKLLERDQPNLFYHRADLLNPEEMTGLFEIVKPSHLLHFAWFVEHGKFWDAPENDNWVRASKNLFRTFIEAGGKRIVAAGTCAEYDWRAGGEKFSEIDSPVNPQFAYGKAKHALHLILQNYAREFGVSYAWGRIFFLFGTFEPPQRFIPSIIRSLLKDEEARTSHGEQIRDFMFVEDAGEAFVKLLDSNVNGAVNIANGSAMALKEIAEMIVDIIGKPDRLRLGALEAPVGEPPILAADTSRLENEVGFRTGTDLRPALEKTINWWKDRL